MDIKQRFNEAFPNFKSEWEAIKKEFNIAPVVPVAQAEPTAPVTPTTPTVKEGKLKDGTVVSWDTDSLQIGSAVSVVDPSNPAGFIPIPDGEVVMEDGTTLTILAGKVTEMESPEAVIAEPVVEVPMAADPIVALEARVKALEDKSNASAMAAQLAEQTVVETEAKFTAQSSELEILKSHLSKVEKFMDEVLSTPSGEPSNVLTSKMSKADKIVARLQSK